MKKIITLALILMSLYSTAANIEYVAGNITYRHIVGVCSGAKFEITVSLFTKHRKIPSSFLNLNGIGGFTFVDSVKLGNNIIKSTYTYTITYPSCGYFIVSCVDTINNQTYKNANINNKAKFYISATIILNPFYLPHNSSFIHDFSPAIKIMKNKPFFFNPITHTNNNLIYDSIIHSPYFYPTTNYYDCYIPNGVKINRTSGEIQWLNPDTLGYYTFFIKSEMYKYGNQIATTFNTYNFDVTNQTPSFIYDSISNVPVNINNFKEIEYLAGNTYSFSAVYNDVAADSIKLIAYPIDFFTTAPIINITKNTVLKNSLFFSWSPQIADERVYPYNFVLQSISYYPNDSISNSYQTVSFISDIYNSIDEIDNSKIKITCNPNPTNSILNINDENNQLQNAIIQIKNYLGQVVFTSPFSNQIDVSNLSAGMYFLTLQDKENKKMVKFVKQ